MSVDIDLVYLPIEDRKTTLTKIEDGLCEVKNKLQHVFTDFKMSVSGQMTQLKQQFIVARTEKTQITLKYLTQEEKKVIKKIILV